MKGNSGNQDNYTKEESSVVEDILNNIEQYESSVNENDCFVNLDKEMELYLKLHIANHRPG